MMEWKNGQDAVPAGARRLPSWERLPDIELYMDQVLLLADRSLRGFPGYDERGLTASMVNNYVKQGALPPPVRKRYGRDHLACLLMICVLKPALPISAIRTLTERQLETRSLEQVYSDFRRIYGEVSETVDAETPQSSPEKAEAEDIWRAALRAAAEQALAIRIFRSRFETNDGDTVSAAAVPGGEKK